MAQDGLASAAYPPLQVCPVNVKVKVICDFPPPADRKQLRCFLGMVGYYRTFCKKFDTVVFSLTDLLSPKTSFKWSNVCQCAFENFKSLLISAPVLAAPDHLRPFSLAVDASDAGVGAVLQQRGADDVEHPIFYFSKKFISVQRKYSTIEKEVLALVLAIQHFEVYLSCSHPVVVYCDHNPLACLNSMYNFNQRLMRWSLCLQPYNLDIRHVRGTDNVVADAL